MMMLQEIDKEKSSPSFTSVHFRKLQVFEDIFCTDLQSPVCSRYDVVPLWDTNMAAGK